MATFLLTWNPKRSDVNPDDLAITASGGVAHGQWSTGSRSGGIDPGDRVFLVRQGTQRGVVGAGIATSRVFLDHHWDKDRDDLAHHVATDWSIVLDISDRLPVEKLLTRVPQIPWNHLQGSGVRVSDDAERRLHKEWDQHLARIAYPHRGGPEEVVSGTYPEGAVSRVTVNRYERDPRARSACLDHHGYDCQICGFNFEKVYGAAGRAVITVHHVRELSTLGPDYELDPIQDLIPVCDNCHRMLHSQRPALTPMALRKVLHPRRAR